MTNEEIIAEIDKRTQELMDEYEERCSSQWEADNRRDYCRNKAISEAFDKARAERIKELEERHDSKICFCGNPQSFPVPHEHDRTKREERIIEHFRAGSNKLKDENIKMKLEQVEKVTKLKEEIHDLYHKIGKAKIWSLNNDQVADECEDFVMKKINEIFMESKKTGEQI